MEQEDVIAQDLAMIGAFDLHDLYVVFLRVSR